MPKNEIKQILEEKTTTVSRILKSKNRRQFYPVTMAFLEIIVCRANEFDYCAQHHPDQISYAISSGMNEILLHLNERANEEVAPVDMTREEYDSLIRARKGLWYAFAVYMGLHFKN